MDALDFVYLSKDIFILRSTGTEPQICVSNLTCCTTETEENLRIKASKKVKTLLQAKYSASKSSLLSIFDDLRGKDSLSVFVN